MRGRRAWGTGRAGRACAVSVAVIAAALAAGAAPAAGAPNLVVYLPPSSLSGLVGGSPLASVVLKNTGSSRAGTSFVRAWLSRDRVLDRSSDLITGGTGRVGPLAAGHTVVVRWHPHIRASTPVGVNYHLIVCTDVTGRVRESKEADNCRASRHRSQVRKLEALIDYPEVGDTTGRTATVYYYANFFPVTATCSLDGGPAVACQSYTGREKRNYGYAVKPYTNLAGGMHTVLVRLRHKTGATATATRSWNVDATPPIAYFVEDIFYTPAEGSTVPDNYASFFWTSDDADVTHGNNSCRLDGGAWEECGWDWYLADLADGPHAFSVRPKDDYGNVGATITRRWIVRTPA